MTWLDFAVLGVIGVSIVWGAWRGLAREVISVAGWVLAFFAANLFGGPLSAHLPAAIPSPELRFVTAFVAVFIVTLAVTTLIALLLSKIIKTVGLGGLDRTLGALFGVARGLLVVLAFALLAGLTGLPREPLWRNSVIGPSMARVALALRPWLPNTFAERLRYD